MEERIQWADLPGSLKESISARTGPIKSGRAVSDGQNSPLAAVVDTDDGRVFVKGMPSGHKKIVCQRREAAAAPLARGLSPMLLWDFDEDGWTVLGFEFIDGRAADYRPGSPDLELIVGLMRALSGVQVPDGHEPVKYADDRWKSYVSDPADAQVFAGSTLCHTDWMPDNVLISGSGAWLIDWAWPTLGAAWIDPACWLLRLMAHGHTIGEAEAWASRLPAYRSADPAHVNAFARANVAAWSEIEEVSPQPWTRKMAAAAREWDAYRARA